MNKKGNKEFIHIIIMVIITIIYCSPFIFILLNAFKNDMQIKANPLAFPAPFTFANFVLVWEAMDFPVVLVRTLFITIASTGGILLMSTMAAYALSRIRFRISRIVLAVFTLAFLIPFQSFMIPLAELAKHMRINHYWGIIPVYWGLGCPLTVFILYGFMQTISCTAEEQALLDGASLFQVFFKVVLPQLTPLLILTSALNALWIWNDFLLPLLVLTGERTLQLALYSFFIQHRNDYGIAAASLVLTSLPVIIFCIFFKGRYWDKNKGNIETQLIRLYWGSKPKEASSGGQGNCL